MTGALATSIIGLPSLGRGFWGWGWDGLPGLFWTLFWVGGIAYLIYYLVQRNNSQKGESPMNRQNFGAPAAPARPRSSPIDGVSNRPAGIVPSEQRRTPAPRASNRNAAAGFLLTVSHLHHAKNLRGLFDAYGLLPAAVRRASVQPSRYFSLTRSTAPWMPSSRKL